MRKALLVVVVCALLGGVLPSAALAAPFNARLAVQVGANGRFNLGAFPDPVTGRATSNSWSLMYSWPSAPSTSYTTFRINGINNIYGSTGTVLERPRAIDARTNRSKWRIGNVDVTQTISIVFNNQTGQEDVARIEYRVENIGTLPQSVGSRIMIDTEINYNDGAVFRVPGRGLVRNESQFIGAAIPDTLQEFFSITNNVHVAASTLKRAGELPPDRLILANWVRLFQNPFDYAIQPSFDFTNPSVARPDSAYALYWNDQPLAPGEARSYVTYYGLAELTVNLQPPLGLGVAGPATLSDVGGEYAPNPFDITATVVNNGTGIGSDVRLTLNLPPELTLVSGPASTPLGALPVGQERQVAWRVRAAPQGTQKTVTYSVSASASNAATKVVPRQLVLPRLAPITTISSIQDSRDNLLPPRGSGSTVDGNSVTVFANTRYPGRETLRGTLLLLSNGVELTRRENVGLGQQPISFSSDNMAWNSAGNRTQAYELAVRFVPQAADAETLTSRPVSLTVRPRPVILVHGWGGKASSWISYTGFLTEMGVEQRDIYAVNTLNMGGGDNLVAQIGWNTDTIDGNARKLGAYIRKAATSSGADRVDIVAHSMGGLVSRRYISTYMTGGTPRVKRLVMLGTPNGGSRTAEFAIRGATLFGPIGRLVALTGFRYPATLQLTPSYLLWFNLTNQERRGVPFYAVAGNYFCPANLLPANPIELDPDDIIVWRESVRAVALDGNWIYPGETTAGCGGFHSGMQDGKGTNGGKAIYDAYVSPLLRGLTPAQSSGLARQNPSEAVYETLSAFQTTIPQTGTLVAGQRLEFVQRIEGGGRTSFVVGGLPSGFIFSLRAPDGRNITPATNAADVVYSRLDDALLPLTSYTITSPVSGNWTFVVAANGQTPAGGLPVSAFVSAESNLRLTVPSGIAWQVNRTVNVAVQLRDGDAPVTGANVTAQLADTNGATTPIVLLDDGQHGDGAANDGVYGYQFVPAVPGLYAALVNASGNAGGGAFTRSGTWAVHVAGTQRFMPLAIGGQNNPAPITPAPTTPAPAPVPTTPAPTTPAPTTPAPTTPTAVTPVPTTPVPAPINRIVFVSTRDGNEEVYSMRDDGSDQRRLTSSAGIDNGGVWSPDGSRIAFASSRDGEEEIYTMNADGSDVRQLTNNSAVDRGPAWSADGTRIAFSSDRDGDREIYSMNVDGSDVRQLTNNTADDRGPAWSPDGTQLVFQTNRDGNNELYVMNSDGTNQRNITNSPGADHQARAAWSPDGSRIAFSSTRDGNEEVYIIRPDGGDARRLTTNSAEDSFPGWSPDGTQIVFETNRDGNREVYVMNADGSNVRRLTTSSGSDLDPKWSPR